MHYSLRSTSPHILAIVYLGLRNTACIVAAFYWTLGCLVFETLEELALRLAQATSPTYCFELPTGEALHHFETRTLNGWYLLCELKLWQLQCYYRRRLSVVMTTTRITAVKLRTIAALKLQSVLVLSRNWMVSSTVRVCCGLITKTVAFVQSAIGTVTRRL